MRYVTFVCPKTHSTPVTFHPCLFLSWSLHVLSMYNGLEEQYLA